ncbi:unnamed protein product [Arabidopsis thaliana]|uniref:non-specific serine/threonine protein kinase n=1 Tax=Arabidopsis thaliana TaxID=3702 RepID=A0A7G2E0L7_ARATH|nr:unnamed protein product [Arabidopsis thaliana]
MSTDTIPSLSSPPAPEFPSTTPDTATSPAPSQPSIIGPSSLAPFPETTTNIDGGSRNVALTGLITGVVLGATFVLLGVCIFVCFYKRKKRKLKKKKKEDIEASINRDSLDPKDNSNNLQQWSSSEIGQNLFTYEDLSKATKKERPVMEWSKRMKIALGAAKGLAYLHEDCNPKTIHRDVKAANILIDDSYEAKLADFGLARSSLDTDTHVSTRIMGTFGYLAPEYASSGKLTEKSDVFSIGVVLLELITGRRPVDKSQPFADDDSIVDWAKPLMIQALNDGNFDGLVDPRLENDFDINEMTRMVACAAASVRHSAKRRPKMSQIVRAFEGNISIDDLTEGAAPGQSTIYSLDGSSDYSSTQYKEDLKKFKKMAFESKTFGSSECSGLTSDNGQNPSGSSSITEGQRTTQEIEPEKNTKDT